MKSDHAYDDIIHLPHPTSKKHPRMSMAERAAQFSPFAALTGFDGVIRETGRLTDQRVELGESDREELERRLNYLDAQEREHPLVQVTYFLPDEKKEGGAYVTSQGRLKRIDPVEGGLLLEGGGWIPIGEIVWIELPNQAPQP
jgi:hypothetical protein